MTTFFICIILIGILMVMIAFIWIVVDKKNARDYRLDVSERTHELLQVIDDADLMLTELNQISDYIVTRMEEKQQVMENMVKAVDERLDLFEQFKNTEILIPIKNDDIPIPETEKVSDALFEIPSVKKGKIIPLDVKKREVIKLCKTGMDSTEIAKILNMGKGEIELISRMCQ